MDETMTWQQDLLAEAKAEVLDYETLALLESCQDALRELAKRTEQAQGQLDGLMWNHEEW